MITLREIELDIESHEYHVIDHRTSRRELGLFFRNTDVPEVLLKALRLASKEVGIQVGYDIGKTPEMIIPAQIDQWAEEFIQKAQE